MLDLGKGLFDRIEVRRVRRQVPEPCTGGPDHTAEFSRLVAAQIVHDDDVALIQDRNELLFDIGAEAFAIDWAIEDARGRELVAAQGPKESKCTPVAMWREAPQARALWSPSAQRSHAGFDPGFIDKYEAAWIEAGLP
jgi:hypothetical protein